MAILPSGRKPLKPKLLESSARRDSAQTLFDSHRAIISGLDPAFDSVSRQTPPAQMAEAEVTGFFTHLARDGGVPASTQNQALSALLFLYKEVLKQELGWRARRSRPTIKDLLFSWLPDSFGVRSRVAIAQ